MKKRPAGLAGGDDVPIHHDDELYEDEERSFQSSADTDVRRGVLTNRAFQQQT